MSACVCVLLTIREHVVALGLTAVHLTKRGRVYVLMGVCLFLRLMLCKPCKSVQLKVRVPRNEKPLKVRLDHTERA